MSLLLNEKGIKSEHRWRNQLSDNRYHTLIWTTFFMFEQYRWGYIPKAKMWFLELRNVSIDELKYCVVSAIWRQVFIMLHSKAQLKVAYRTVRLRILTIILRISAKIKHINLIDSSSSECVLFICLREYHVLTFQGSTRKHK